jgi:hypothetical protein
MMMRYALSSDIHSKLPALEAVLADIDGRMTSKEQLKAGGTTRLMEVE